MKTELHHKIITTLGLLAALVFIVKFFIWLI